MAGVTAASLLVAGLLGCATPPEVSLCSGPVERVDVFNAYRDHPVADHQALTDADDIAGYCDSVWSRLALQPHQYQPSELGQRGITVLELHLISGSMRTIWVHKLPGFDAGSAVLYDTGESYYLRHQDIPLYYAAAAEPIPREQVPAR